MNRLQRWMMGRYGTDQLGIFLLVAVIVLSFVQVAVQSAFISTVSIIVILWALFRMFSRNIVRRRWENDRFWSVFRPVWEKGKGLWFRLRDLRTHRYFGCPNCQNTLRVPRGKGTLRITCPRCGTQFQKKT